MAFGKKFVLCSPFSGAALSSNDQPMPGVVIERRWVWGWNGKQGMDTVTTDSNGHFEFPEVIAAAGTAAFLPHEPDIQQVIRAKMPSGELEIWVASKRNYSLNGELDGRPIQVKCYLDREASADGLLWGTCEEK
ncbi:Uncharacterised protein [BD1-7 clade bacterium]|uniref:DUF6795 domain-containing protein n=1 Tax=BD1-7 clade bacterium TaxID=2029982 RepID=A0A5S9Q5A7_9GAMM|nr:Uncharacterised protein [BD1-7 clade bacterium]CAA0112975.1 Uncharacterised protein [BD1-7 clade bacterium]